MLGETNKLPENLLAISWQDAGWIPHLTVHNVMDYFSERSNPFYDRTCNNEVLRMQRVSLDNLTNMQGIEYTLLHVQEPILYVIRKQQRHSPSQVTPIANYYIIAGTIYQAPDLGSVLNSRLLTTVNHLQSAFEEARHFSKYHPSKGYWWDFGSNKKMSEAERLKEEELAKLKEQKKNKSNKKSEEEKRIREEPSSIFQRRRVDMLLDHLTKRFPPKLAAPPGATQANGNSSANNQQTSNEKLENGSSESKSEKDDDLNNGKMEKSDSQNLKREAPGPLVKNQHDTKRAKLG